jgi:hypothetical protein
MAKKKPPRFSVAPLQRVVGIPITDPVEIARMEKISKQYRAARRKLEGTTKKEARFSIAPLQRIVGIPITDPVEIARMEKISKQCRAARLKLERQMSRRKAK